jgi:hypothetical protein
MRRPTCAHVGLVWLAAALAVPAAEREPEPIDCLQLAVDFADCMIAHGRDRYGAVHSPLFANLLLRSRIPTLPPYPLFEAPADMLEKAAQKRADCEAAGKTYNPFHLFNFNRCLNYPDLGGEGPHKMTLYGSDPSEDRDLYALLFELTTITGDARYAREAREALEWFFRHTQGPGGLFAWGEHLGWDFENECPTYFAGPSQYLFSACWHEIKDEVPFLDVLADMPAAEPGGATPLEMFALGIWRMHFWDKERAWFTRHGDWRGEDFHRDESSLPAHLAAYFHVWATALQSSTRPAFRAELRNVFDRTLDMALARTERWGAYPWNLEPDFKADEGKSVKPNPKPCEQTLRLARHARRIGESLRATEPVLAAKLETLAELHLGPPAAVAAPPAVRPPAPPPRVVLSDRADTLAADMERFADLYVQERDPAYLAAAEALARHARDLYLDGICPLPRARLTPATLRDGASFPDFYWRGATLMRAFAKVGALQRPHRR